MPGSKVLNMQSRKDESDKSINHLWKGIREKVSGEALV